MCLRSWIGSMRHLRGLDPLKVDIAYGGDSFVIVDAAPLGFAIRADEARDLAKTGAALSLPFHASRGHRLGPHLLLPVRRAAHARGKELQGSNAVVVCPGKIDRSPTLRRSHGHFKRARAHGEG
jgi:trans-L-3-hydroxyproline dehydratase